MSDTFLTFSLIFYYIGRYADITAIYLLFAYQTHQPVLILMLIPFIRSSPHVIFAPFIGILIDRITSMKYIFYSMLCISVLIASSAFITDPWLLLLLLLLRTILRTGVQPSFIKFFRAYQTKKLAKNNMQRLLVDSLMSVVTPALVGILVINTCVSYAFILSATSYLSAAFIFMVYMSNLGKDYETKKGITVYHKKITYEWKGILLSLFKQNRVIFLIASSTLVAFIVALLRGIYPLLAYNNQFSEFEYSLIMSQYGLGNCVVLILIYKKIFQTRFYKKFYYSFVALALAMGLIATEGYSRPYLPVNMLSWLAIGSGATFINFLQIIYISRLFAKNKQASIHATINFLNGLPIILLPLMGLLHFSIENIQLFLIVASSLLLVFSLFKIIQARMIKHACNR